MAQTLSELKQILAAKLQKGCVEGAIAIKENTPIDTQRLFESVDATEAEISDSSIKCKIVVGGKALFGVRRETNIQRPVGYAKYVEARYGFVRQSLGDVRQKIEDNLKG